jgi:hypothetical protein
MRIASHGSLWLFTSVFLNASTAFVPYKLIPAYRSQAASSNKNDLVKSSYLLAKKKGSGGNAYKPGARGQQPQQEKKSVQDARLDAAT